MPTNVATAFLAGLVSFVSPCVLPLVPAYLSFLTGSGLEELKASQDAAQRARTLMHALAFIIGFTIVFILIGLSAGALGAVFANYKDQIARVGGVVIIILGLNMMGVFKIPLLMMDKRLHMQNPNRSLFASFMVGIGFAAGWSPCIGPILAGILAIASQQHSAQAALLLAFYCLGLALPFLAVAAAIGFFLPLLRRIRPSLRAIEFAAGAFLIVVGLVLVNDAFLNVAGWFYQFVPQPSL